MSPTLLKRLLGAVALLAGLTWAVLFGLAVQGWESERSRDVRTAAFVVTFVAGSLYPLQRQGGGGDDETL